MAVAATGSDSVPVAIGVSMAAGVGTGYMYDTGVEWLWGKSENVCEEEEKQEENEEE